MDVILIGYLGHWNLSKTDRWQLIEEAVRQNRDLIFDENLKNSKSRGYLDFHKRYVENRSKFSCQNSQSLISVQYNENNNGFMADLFEVIAGLHGFFDENVVGQGAIQPGAAADFSDSDSEDYGEDEDDLDDISDEEDVGLLAQWVMP